MESVEGRLAAAEQALRQGQARVGLEEARAVLRIQPEYGRAYAVMGLAYAMMGEEPDARRCLTKAAEIAPLDSRVRYHSYLGLAQLRDVPGARAQLTYFVQLEPENKQALAVLTQLGGPVQGLPPLPRVSSVSWYDAGGPALTNAAEDVDLTEGAEPPAGPDVMECPSCRKRTWKSWVCMHCSMNLPRP